jgi:plastocyanin domain-containing protein
MKFLILIAIAFSGSVYAADSAETVVVNISVTEKGFEPNKIDVATDKPVKLSITRKTDDTCSTSIQIPSKKIKKELPLNKTISIDLGKLSKGEIRFGCGMNMMDSGMIYVK